MRKRISEKTKISRGYGVGTGKNYKPWNTVDEFNSLGTTSVIKDWKTGRPVHCLSQGEMLWYYILRWDDDNIDIREQFPLDRSDTESIAALLGFKHPNVDRMSIDFFVTEKNGDYHAYSIKSDNNLSNRTKEKLCIEKKYCELHGYKYSLLFKTDANKILASNIRQVVEFYDAALVFDKYSALKHKIAIKEILTDLEHAYLTTETFDRLLEKK